MIVGFLSEAEIDDFTGRVAKVMKAAAPTA